MISTSPSSFAASSAPLFAASKTPFPSDFTTSAIFTSAALAAVVITANAKAALMANLFASFMLHSSQVGIHSSCGLSGRRRGILLTVLVHGSSDNQSDADVFYHS